MQIFKSSRRILAIALTLAMVFSIVPATTFSVHAGNPEKQAYFPYYQEKTNLLLGDEHSRYVTTFLQDPLTKMITATVAIQNNNTGAGAENINVQGVGWQISFSDKVAPYAYDPTNSGDPHEFDESRLYKGELDSDSATFTKYFYTPVDALRSFSNNRVSNDSNERMIGAIASVSNIKQTISISPGKSEVVAQFFFMPVDGKATLSTDMFDYKYTRFGPARLTTWWSLGTSFVVPSSTYPTSEDPYVVSPESFKLHVQHPTPVNLEAGEEEGARKIVGYDKDTMEWSTDETGPFISGEPVIDNGTQTIYVRVKGDDNYSGSDVEYGDYKMYLASEAVAVVFDEGSFSINPEVSKTSKNLDREDGTTHVNDTLQYTIVAKNNGETGSVWKDVVVTDELPEGITLVKGSVKVNGVVVNDGYDEVTRTLTIPMGDVAGQEETALTFDVTVDADAYNKDITNSATTKGNDGEGGAEIEKNVKEEENRKVAGGEYNVTYDAGEGEGTAQVVLENAGDEHTVLSNESTNFTKDGYYFVGWNTEKDGSGTAYLAGAKFTVDKEVTLYAQWDVNAPVQHNVTYDAGEGEGTAQVVLENTGDEHTVLSNESTNFIKDGYHFVGWNTEKDGSGTAYLAGAKFTVDKEVTLYAQWDADTTAPGKPEPVAEKSSENLSRKDGKNYIGDVLEYTIKVGNEGTGDWNNVIINDVLPDGLTMTKGVQINGSPVSSYIFDSATRTLSISLGTVSAGTEKVITFKAIIDADAEIGSTIKNKAKISGIDDEDKGVNIDVEEPGDGRKIEKPEDKEDGFFAVKTSRNTTSIDEKTYIGDIIEYIITIGNNAKVKEIEEHTITYNANEGTGPDHLVVVTDENHIILDNTDEGIGFTREDFVFAGWNTATDGTDVQYEAGETIIVTEDITLYAQWNAVGTDPEGDDPELNTAEPEAPATGETTGDEDATEEESDKEAVLEEESGEETVIEEASDNEAAEQESEDEASVEEVADVTNNTSEDVKTNDDTTIESNGSDFNQSKEAMLSMLRTPMYSIGSTRALNDSGNTSIVRILGEAGTSSYWYQTSVTDKLPAFVTFVEGSVKINGQKTDKYIFENGILTVKVGDIPAGELIIVTFDVAVDDDAAGKTIKNVATVSGQDEDGKDIDKEAEEPDGGREVEETKDLITITYKAGSGTGSDRVVKVKSGIDHKALTTADAGMSKSGYSFASWNTEENASGTIYKSGASIPTTGNITLYAQWTKNSTGGGGGGGGTTIKDDKTPLGLNKEDHIAYVKGYPEGDFRPEKSITRAEAAQLFYNLLVGVKKTGYSTQFGDVNAGAWYADAVNCLSANNIIQGYPDGSFKPNNYITRAEFATLSSKFDKLSASDSNRFNDVNDSHWAVSYINSAAVKGWIKGYENGEFRPAKNITRAEVVTLVNAILERKVSAGDILSNAKTFNDLATSHWAYCDIMEAANEHTYSRKEDKIHETWIEVIR